MTVKLAERLFDNFYPVIKAGHPQDEFLETPAWR
jgi:hypothetical protein